ncbi:hypothetical protein CkaCkLH20_07792 [Colletotrichum karsti]|uniref:Uncharacterized protein n=1 Tax=Colletotrichum karsti TaxID=1095194 RepID=A0A9P6I2L1_9PEZI|nr:uncharacterized protein CkaCkLH20_07792 [Colletotrichum karsti]KAF9874655.1 hypothetical protein CkaCkLH20_07792 [Colletotrichum karsti]
MVAIALAGSSPKGKGVTMSILLLVTTFLVGLAAGFEISGFDRNWTMDIDPSNPITRPEFAGINLNLTNHTESAFKLPKESEINWKSPPLWAIRPEQRPAFLAGGASALDAFKNGDDINPCEERRWGATLYETYYEDRCPAKFHTDGIRSAASAFGTCEKWNSVDGGLECASFCQMQTHFEWAQEAPFPNSDCHYPVKCKLAVSDKTSVGWSINLSPKVGKALKLGISGNYHNNHDLATNHAYDIDMTEELPCGYFTFVPVKKVVCGVMSESRPGLTHWVGDDGVLGTGCSTWGGPNGNVTNGDHRAWNNGSYCASDLWKITDRDDPNRQVPDGVVFLVYTDCKTRAPLDMEYQDPIYKLPGVALDHTTVRALHDSWITNFCWFGDFDTTDGYKKLFMIGSGFEDNRIGDHDGTGLIKSIRECAGGDLQNVTWRWFNPNETDTNPKMQGAFWQLEAMYPVDKNGGCVGNVIMDAGGKQMDRCQDGS